MHRLETERLNLRWFVEDDAEFLLKLLNDPAFIRNIADRNVRDIPAAIEYIGKFKRDGYDKLGFGVFLVELKATGEKMGICSLVKRPTLDDAAICDPSNSASCRLLEKLGLRFEQQLLLDARPTLLYRLNFK